MKRFTAAVLVLLSLFLCVNVFAAEDSTPQKNEEKKAIAIVFDNSGSMYYDDESKPGTIIPLTEWCRATYAMEVFASMLNKGDTLLIYPMWPIEVDGKEYTMENPMKITSSKQSSDIRNIYTPDAMGTPSETINCAIDGVKQISADKKYVIILTDGGTFDINGISQGDNSKSLIEGIIDNAGEDLTMMYLGIGKKALDPDSKSEHFVKKRAENSENVLSSLTDMCNTIFGRDTLTEKHRHGRKIDFDVSMSKLIVFVQGKNISDLKVVDKNGKELKQVSKTSTKYAEKGFGNKGYDGKQIPFGVDDELQGMMVTYEDCDQGTYTVEFSGKETSIEVYYEPDVDLDFVFTDLEGGDVDPEALYEGDYKVSFGMVDAKTGELAESDLLGTPNYNGEYTIENSSGKETTPIVSDGYSGVVEVALKYNDKFDAKLTVTYLSGFKITKYSIDFGWPFGGIKVAARPAGNMRIEISDGQDVYSLQDLEKGKQYTLKVYYEGTQLTGEELSKVALDIISDNVKVEPEFAEDHYKLRLMHDGNPQDTKVGKNMITVKANYTKDGSEEAMAQKAFTYMINDDAEPLHLELSVPDSYIIIGELDESRPIVAALSLKGKKLSEEDFKSAKVTVDCGGIDYKLSPDAKNSAYTIKLLPTDGIAKGDYKISVHAEYADHIERVTTADAGATVSLGLMPLWLIWLIRFLILFIIAFIIWLWLRTPVLPKVIDLDENSIAVSIDGEKQKTLSATVDYPKSGKKRTITIEASPGALSNVYISATLIPTKDSYRYLPSSRRKAMVINGTVDATRSVNIVTLGNARFIRDENGNLVPKPPSTENFEFNAPRISFSGSKSISGRNTDFSIIGNIVFRDKK